eukprot:c33842_g1_i1 orf=71-247(+)
MFKLNTLHLKLAGFLALMTEGWKSGSALGATTQESFDQATTKVAQLATTYGKEKSQQQ